MMTIEAIALIQGFGMPARPRACRNESDFHEQRRKSVTDVRLAGGCEPRKIARCIYEILNTGAAAWLAPVA
jgi:hypothetical protein